jgi:hypothetical protein
MGDKGNDTLPKVFPFADNALHRFIFQAIIRERGKILPSKARKV